MKHLYGKYLLFGNSPGVSEFFYAKKEKEKLISLLCKASGS